MLFKKNKQIKKISPLPDEKAVTIGRVGEDAAVEFLRKAGYTVIGRNFRAGKNELDIIAEDRKYLVFVEVKSRTCNANGDLTYGNPSSSVTYSKKQRTLAAAGEYMRQKGTKGKQPRIDVIEVFFAPSPKLSNTKEIVKINHIINAFGA